MNANVEALRTAVANQKLTGSDATFASDLIASFDKRDRLSDRQFYWVNELLTRASAERPAAAAPTALAASVGRVFELFATAKAHGLKYPKIRLQTPDGECVVLNQAGAKSKYTGQVQLTDGAGFGQNRYFGRIDQTGALHAGRDLTPEVRALIEALAADPENVAGIHGHRTGECCFCATGLKDSRSLEVGYGPVCAKNFGLKWGGKKVDTAVHVALFGDLTTVQQAAA